MEGPKGTGAEEGARRFFDPLGEFSGAPQVRHTYHRRKPKRRELHQCPWCGGWFWPPRHGSPWRFCSLVCRRECHEVTIPAGVSAGQTDREIARRLGLSPAYLRQKRLALGALRRPEPPHLRQRRLEKNA